MRPIERAIDISQHQHRTPEFWFGIKQDSVNVFNYNIAGATVNTDFYMGHSGAANTRTGVQRAWAYFGTFLNECVEKGHPFFAPSSECFKNYAVWRQCQGLVSADTINVEISSINRRLHDLGHGWDRKRYGTGLRHLLDGMRRSQNLILGEKIPNDTRALVNILCDKFVLSAPSPEEGALILIGKHAVLRCDNIISNKNLHHLCVGHVSVNPRDDTVLLKLPGSKTNQLNLKKEYRTLWHRCKSEKVSEKLCAACAVLKLISGRGQNPDAPLFVQSNGKPFTYAKIHTMMRKLAKKFKLNPKFYTPHCLRIGGATDLYQEYGKDVDWIKLHCNWKSTRTVLERYLKLVNPDVVELVE